MYPNYRIILILLVHCCALQYAYADVPDSLDQADRARYALDPVATYERVYIREQPIWIRNWKDNFNQLSLRTTYDKGRYIPAQGSTRTRAYYFDTEGKTTWRKVQLYGRFAYTKQYEDSTRLRHQTRINESAPLYFGSLRYNHYERSVYQLQAALQKDLLAENLPLTLGLNYRVGEHFSNNDPRGAINDFQLNLLAALGYRSPAWQYHATFRYGYGRERVQVAYKNEKYTENVEDPLYVNWYNNGYGNAIQKTNAINYNDDMKRFGAGAHVAYNANAANTWQADVDWLHEQQQFKQYNESPLTYALFNTYNEDRFTTSVFWKHHPSSNTDFNWNIHLEMIDGHDDHPTLGVSNYLYRKESYGSTWRLNKNRWHYLAAIDYHYLLQQDGNTSAMSEVSQLQFQLGFGRNWVLGTGGQQVQVQLRGGYHLPLSGEFAFNNINESYFVNHVIYYDYLYRYSPATETGASFTYLFPTGNKGMNWSIGLSADYILRGTLPDYTFQPLSIPGKNRLSSFLQVNVYF
ncbi:hypothetical protein GCM10023231_12800 [Olivibacter ginsenosidimutans]|uniref:DUF6850 domain-containing protein n=1 Tax=Olivibacter ginsenosidimutans TaxID=1176537 RepID=A0ABP9AUY3_9SPHI